MQRSQFGGYFRLFSAVSGCAGTEEQVPLAAQDPSGWQLLLPRVRVRTLRASTCHAQPRSHVLAHSTSLQPASHSRPSPCHTPPHSSSPSTLHAFTSRPFLCYWNIPIFPSFLLFILVFLSRRMMVGTVGHPGKDSKEAGGRVIAGVKRLV